MMHLEFFLSIFVFFPRNVILRKNCITKRAGVDGPKVPERCVDIHGVKL
jgi:hypothetical protein